MGSYTLSDLDGFLYGTVVNVRERFGFIKPDKRLPHPYNSRKQIYFSADMTNITEVNNGQRVVLKLNMDNTEKPAASKIRMMGFDDNLRSMEPFYIRPECGHIGSSVFGEPDDVCSVKAPKLLQCGHRMEDMCFVTRPEMCDECYGIQAEAQDMFSVSESEVILGTVTYVGEGHGYIKPCSALIQRQNGKGGVYFTFDGTTSVGVASGQRVVFTQKLGRQGKPTASKMATVLKDLDGDTYIREITQVVRPWNGVVNRPTASTTHVDAINPADKLEAQAAEGISDTMLTYNLYPRRQVNADDPKDINFRIAESHFLRLAQKAGKQYEIESVTYYVNPPLVRKFRAKMRQFEAIYGKGLQSKHVLAFHGTRQANIDSIVRENFKLEFCQRSLYGRGIYLSEFPHVSLDFGTSLLLCKVLPGNSWDMNYCQSDGRITPGYDSHRVKADEDGYGWALVVENSDQILPCYKVNYKRHDDHSAASRPRATTPPRYSQPQPSPINTPPIQPQRFTYRHSQHVPQRKVEENGPNCIIL